ncbi:alpha/beta fold hydrolase [Streptomyces sp. UNOC14_S4]|uniref:alpha/beta fold hydrolase n=1 Tax=Streptomyces sp. UNOC14_S4 TaxID=2872340 RepID=UPI001E5BE8E4|nr:alpha/beta hydrolase [Streptomyces sp. UNOC14_S4]MCC3766838.1 alpha/beta hydrolase [Streptomyces sp. UNOC14_S4]
MSTIEISRGPVEYTVLGGDPDTAPLVLLHEGLGCIAMWRRFPARLAAATGRRVLVYSRHGYGSSGPARLPRSPRYMHEEAYEVLPELLDRLGLRRPVLVGHSDGASIALLHAAAHPVEAAVAMAPHLFAEERTLRGVEAARASYLSGPLARELAFYHQDPRAVFEGWSDVWLSPAFRSWDIASDLAGVTAPVLLVQGDRDQYGSPAHLDAAQRALTGPVHRLELADCGHSPHLDRTADVVDAVRTFLTDHLTDLVPQQQEIRP